MRTTHQYLEQYPIAPDSEKLIVGTIHPHYHDNFLLPFFYGNVLSIWSILGEAFPQELPKPLTLEGIVKFLRDKKISVSDTVLSCERKNPTALDQDLTCIELNRKIMDDIRNSAINEVLFTSGFGKNNAFKLFYVDILGRKITQDIREKREVTLEEELFGRPVKLTILYSPSGSSNVGLSKSKAFRDYLERKKHDGPMHRPVFDFKVDFYRSKFGGE